jgi:hypothetical protein
VAIEQTAMLRQDFLERADVALARQRAICHRPQPVAAAVFADILRGLRGTAFEREHGLARVRDERDWRAAVPIRGYDHFVPYIRRLLAGERQVLTAKEPYAFLRTSGTTGTAKLVPTTAHWRARYRGPALYAQWGLYFERLGLAKLAEGDVLDLSWEPRQPYRFEHGFPIYGITERPVAEDPDDWNPPWRTAAWTHWDPSAPTLSESLYRKLMLLAGHDLQLIVSVNPSKIVLLVEVLRAEAARLVRDVHDGVPSARPRDRALARRLTAVFERAGWQPTLTDLWPGLRLLVCWNSASAGLYGPWLARLAPGVAQIPFSTTGTEGTVTLPVDDHPSAGPLAPNQGLFEFVPWDDLDDGSPLPAAVATCSPDELEVGATYRIVMTQANGLYRYDVGDVYQVAGAVGGSPRLEFLGRAGFQSSFTGEKLTESDVHTAVTRVLGPARATHPDFCGVPVWGTPPRYVVAVEWPDGLAALPDVARRVDEVLQDVNVEYADKRRSGRLRPISILPLVAGAFMKVAEHNFRLGVPGAQIKHHWLHRDEALLDTLSELGLVRPEHRELP